MIYQSAYGRSRSSVTQPGTGRFNRPIQIEVHEGKRDGREDRRLAREKKRRRSDGTLLIGVRVFGNIRSPRRFQ